MAESSAPAQLLGMPAAEPPPGVIPNTVNPYTTGPVFISVGAILVAIMLMFVSMRIWVKVRIAKRWSPDDYTCLIATTGTILYYIIGIFAVTAGHFGTHMWDLTVRDVTGDAFLMSGFFVNWVTALVWPFVKLTFFLLYIQLFRPMKWLRYCSYAGATVNVLFYFSVIVATFAFTIPAPGETMAEQVQSPRQAHALDLTIPIASMSLVLDVYILILPIAGVSRLQLTWRRKMGIMAVFLTGVAACVASSLSIYYKWVLDRNVSDTTYRIMPVILAALVEMCVGVTASCMPSTSKLLHEFPSWELFRSKVFSHFSSSKYSSHHSHKNSNSEPPYSKGDRAGYKDLAVSNSELWGQNHEMAPIKSIRTYIHAGKPSQVEEDGIHLQYNVQQESKNV